MTTRHTVTGLDTNANPVFREVMSVVNLDGSMVGGSAATLSDVLLTDSTGTLFIARDNGATLTYWGVATNAAYTPSGTIQVADTLAAGTDNTGVSQPAGGLGVRGWLSAIYSKMVSSIAVTGTFWPTTQPVSAASLPLPAGAATAALQPALNGDGGALAHVSNFPATQPVSIAAMPSTPVTGTFWPTTQPVSGAVLETDMASFLDSTTTAGYVYFLTAQPGTLVSQALWKVSRMNTTNAQVQWANGNANYTNYGTGYAALTYS